VALSRALATEPEVLLLDEPFGALDPHLRRQMEAELRAILSTYRGAAVMVTHDRNEAYRLCEELVVLSRGRVEAAGAREEIFANPGTVAAARVTGCKNISRLQGAFAQDWNCELQRLEAPPGITHIGIRAHHIVWGRHSVPAQTNVFSARLVDTIESPFEVTLYLELNPGQAQSACPTVEMEVSTEEWKSISGRPQPWDVQLPADRLLFLRDG
jgi:ABC-type sulfate/molybdate transport systems ATPase subunit